MYQILLEDRITGRTALIECPANMLLEELSVKIKVELNLPLCDREWHRFLYKGKCYVPFNHLCAEPEIIWESTERYPPRVYCSEKVRLKHLYTVLGSTITYIQDVSYGVDRKVRCIMVGRGNSQKDFS